MSSITQPLDSATRLTLRRPPAGGLVAAAGALGVFASLVGPVWSRVPANPAAGTPAARLDFSELAATVTSHAVPSTWLQHSYFAWLAWTLLAGSILAVAAYVTTRSRRAGVSVAVLGVAGIVLTVVALKGTMTWSQAWAARSLMSEQLGVGCVLLLAGYLAMTIGGLVAVIRRR